MSLAFEFATAGRILFGAGRSAKLPELAAARGGKVLLVCGSDPSRVSGLLGSIEHEVFQVTGEPDVPRIEAGVEKARGCAAELVIAIGGGSVVDSGKAIAAMLGNPGELLDYLEVVGRGQALARPSAPFIAVPTTAGTGAEVTKNAVIGVPSERVKVSMRSPHMLPEIALVDPELCLSQPRAVAASTGLDALTQLIEPFLSARANPMTDALCREAIPKAAWALPRIIEHPEDLEARSALSMAAMFSGIALANAGLGAAHGFAGPMGGMFDAAHGSLCACFLPHVVKANHLALLDRERDSTILPRFDELARMLTGSDRAKAPDGIRRLSTLSKALEIPRLSALGVSEQDFPAIVEKARRASSMKANPIVLSERELLNILRLALG